LRYSNPFYFILPEMTLKTDWSIKVVGDGTIQ